MRQWRPPSAPDPKRFANVGRALIRRLRVHLTALPVFLFKVRSNHCTRAFKAHLHGFPGPCMPGAGESPSAKMRRSRRLCSGERRLRIAYAGCCSHNPPEYIVSIARRNFPRPCTRSGQVQSAQSALRARACAQASTTHHQPAVLWALSLSLSGLQAVPSSGGAFDAVGAPPQSHLMLPGREGAQRDAGALRWSASDDAEDLHALPQQAPPWLRLPVSTARARA